MCLQSSCTPESAELFASCLKAMVEMCDDRNVRDAQESNIKETAGGRGGKHTTTGGCQPDIASKARPPPVVATAHEHTRASSKPDASSVPVVE